MRSLFLLRGVPASGKSTWVKENNLEAYTLSTDAIRLMNQSPVTAVTGESVITQKNDKEVWDLLFSLLERRMDRGDFTIVDATHYKSTLLSKYKDYIDKYRYRVYVVDFTDVSIEEIIKRNESRPSYKKVPEEVIEKMYAAIKDDSEVLSGFKVITPKEAADIINAELTPIEVDKEKVVVFGDIHGCFAPLNEYFTKHPFNNDTCYIFTGDYLDRGIQNKETLEFLLSIYKNSNVVLLEGNHERWLRIYADKDYDINDYIKSENAQYKSEEIAKLLAWFDRSIHFIEKDIKTKGFLIDRLKKELELEKIKNKDADKILYEFEWVNVDDKCKEINALIENNNKKIELLKAGMLAIEKVNDVNSTMINDLLRDFGNDDEIGRQLKTCIYSKKAKKEDNPIRGREFLYYTYPQIKDMDKSKIRQLCRKFAQMSYFKLGDQKYLVTHAGVSTMPNILTATDELIKGIGTYEDSNIIEEAFFNKYGNDIRQIHAHRNVYDNDTVLDRCINLEGKVEWGHELRVVEISKNGSIEVQNVKNDVYGLVEEDESANKMSQLEILREMYRSPLIEIKNLEDDIQSFNFSRDAFNDSKWNKLTCTARGLFVDKRTGEICARSFNKFFNYREVEWTKKEYLLKHLTFPVVAYKKENGYLGLITKYKGKMRYFTKSSDGGDYVKWFIENVCRNLNVKDKEELDAYLSDKIKEGYTYIFECVDQINDPHIIKYADNQVYLLEVIENHIDKEVHKSYDELCDIANTLGFKVKEKAKVFNTFDELEKFIDNFTTGDSQWECHFEGYVLEDAKNFRFKLKSSYYRFWKYMRGALEQLQRGRGIQKIYKDKDEILVMKFMQELGREKLEGLSIIDIQNMYYRN